MARLIEVQNPQGVSSSLALQVGDVLLFNATGGHIQSGDDVVEMLGAFLPAILGDNGEIFELLKQIWDIVFQLKEVFFLVTQDRCEFG